MVPFVPSSAFENLQPHVGRSFYSRFWSSQAYAEPLLDIHKKIKYIVRIPEAQIPDGAEWLEGDRGLFLAAGSRTPTLPTAPGVTAARMRWQKRIQRKGSAPSCKGRDSEGFAFQSSQNLLGGRLSRANLPHSLTCLNLVQKTSYLLIILWHPSCRRCHFHIAAFVRSSG